MLPVDTSQKYGTANTASSAIPPTNIGRRPIRSDSRPNAMISGMSDSDSTEFAARIVVRS